MKKLFLIATAIISALAFFQCRSKVHKRTDEVYSRYLQKKVTLTIYNTPVPDDKSDFGLLLINDKSSFEKIDIAETLKTLVKEKSISPLIVVMFDADSKYFGTAGDGKTAEKNRDAEKFQDFMVKELIPFAKKNAGARKFSSIAIAGYQKSTIPVWDAAWDHAATYQKVGIFEPTFTSTGDTTVIFNKIHSSRKRPNTAFWIWTTKPEEKRQALTLLTDEIMRKVSPAIEINDSSGTLKEAFISFLQWAFPG